MLIEGLVISAVCVAVVIAEPPSEYLPPSGYSTLSQSSFSPPATSFDLGSGYTFAKSKSYLPPKVSYSPPPKPIYHAPSPAPVYSAPAPTPVYSAPKPVYGAPSHHHHHEDYPSAPAHYEYQYTVHDSHYGTDFGHKENRQGDVTHGQYMVLLPDGRRQIVDYVADKNGYRPTIRYEGEAKPYNYQPSVTYGTPSPRYGPPKIGY